MEKNKTGKYFKYAVGEIVLVVIGILIALSINNWNELRKDKIKERAVLTNLVQYLRSDSISYSRNFKTLLDINMLHNQLYEIGINGKDNIIIENPNNIRRTPYYNPITKENDPSIASKISNDTIKTRILNYFRNMKDMDNTFSEFDAVIHNRIRVFLGEKGAHDLSSWFDNQSMYISEGEIMDIISSDELKSLSKMTEFQQLFFEASIKLSDLIRTLEILIDQNKKLISTIEIVLSK
jgi:type II secretory pathway pseudopilin PulG